MSMVQASELPGTSKPCANSALSLGQRVGVALVLMVLLIFGLFSFWYGGRAAWTDAQTLQARWQVNLWREARHGAPTAERWQYTVDQLASAHVMDPGNAQLLDDLGFLYALGAQGLGSPVIGSAVDLQQQDLLMRAVQSYRAATNLRPTFPYAWGYLALAKQMQNEPGEPDAEYWLAFDKSLQFGQNEAGVQPTLAFLAFSQWDTLSSGRKQAITRMVATAHPASRQVLLDIAVKAHVTLAE